MLVVARRMLCLITGPGLRPTSPASSRIFFTSFCFTKDKMGNSGKSAQDLHPTGRLSGATHLVTSTPIYCGLSNLDWTVLLTQRVSHTERRGLLPKRSSRSMKLWVSPMIPKPLIWLSVTNTSAMLAR